MNTRHTLSLAVLALGCIASSASHADAITLPLDLSQGNASFGRNNAVGSFVDTYLFSLLGTSYLLASTASSASSGLQDLDISGIVINDAFDNLVATFAGNLGTDANEFFELTSTLFAAGSYKLVVSGVNSPTQASYTGNLSVSRVQGVPEPGGVALVLAGLGLLGWQQARRSPG
jgi:hypothetical protein